MHMFGVWMKKQPGMLCRITCRILCVLICSAVHRKVMCLFFWTAEISGDRRSQSALVQWRERTCSVCSEALLNVSTSDVVASLWTFWKVKKRACYLNFKMKYLIPSIWFAWMAPSYQLLLCILSVCVWFDNSQWWWSMNSSCMYFWSVTSERRSAAIKSLHCLRDYQFSRKTRCGKGQARLECDDAAMLKNCYFNISLSAGKCFLDCRLVPSSYICYGWLIYLSLV